MLYSSDPLADSEAQKLYATWKILILLTCLLAFIVVIVQFLPATNLFANLKYVSQLVCALIGGGMTVAVANSRMGRKIGAITEKMQQERIGWTLIGIGLLSWGVGELIWRYQLLSYKPPFPSLADLGYSLMPVFVFAGLLIQPTVFHSRQERLFTSLDSFIAAGSIVAISWFFLMGSPLLSAHEGNLERFLSVYYPTADILLLCCAVTAFLRGRRYLCQTLAFNGSWVLVGIGICGFLFSDFVFYLQQDNGAYVNDSFLTLGWSIGMLIVGIAAPLRYVRSLSEQGDIHKALQEPKEQAGFCFVMTIPYLLFAVPFLIIVWVTCNHSRNNGEFLPVLCIITLIVFCALILRQILTTRENIYLVKSQSQALMQLEEVKKQIELQAQQVEERNTNLEQGIHHLKYVLASLANGNLRTRARLTSDSLLPLAGGLNLLAERLYRLEWAESYAENVTAALVHICNALERRQAGKPLVLYPTYKQFVITKRLVSALGIQDAILPANRVAITEPISQVDWPKPSSQVDRSKPNSQVDRSNPSSQADWSKSTFPHRYPQTGPLSMNGTVPLKRYTLEHEHSSESKHPVEEPD